MLQNGAFCKTFDLHSAIIGLSLQPSFGLFASGRFTQVLMFKYDIYFYLEHCLQGHNGNAKPMSPGKHCAKYEYPTS